MLSYLNLLRLQRRGIRVFSSEVSPMSKRKQFRQIPLDYSIVNKLDELKLGYNSTRRVRVSVAKKFGNLRGKAPAYQKESVQQVLKKQLIESPYPFRKYGIKLHNASTFSEVPTKFYGNPLPSEVAIIGRSNVGKSTLINSLLSFDDSYIQKAEVSNKPGLTKQLQFYGLGIHPVKDDPIITTPTLNNASNNISQTQKQFQHQFNANTEIKEKPKKFGSAVVLVDMPGYGFSYMNDDELNRVQKLCSDYLRYRGSKLKRVILLIDGRHGLKITDKIYFKNLVEGIINSNTDLKDEQNQTIRDESDDNPYQKSKDKKDKNRKPAIKSKSSVNQQEGNKEKIDYFEFDSSSSNKLPSSSSSSNKFKPKSNIHWKLQIILTKCDLIDRNELARRIQHVQDSLSEALPGFGNMLSVMALSGKYGNGVLQLKQELASLVTPPPVWENTTSTRKTGGKVITYNNSSVNTGYDSTATTTSLSSTGTDNTSTDLNQSASSLLRNYQSSSEKSVDKLSGNHRVTPFSAAIAAFRTANSTTLQQDSHSSDSGSTSNTVKYVPPSHWQSTLPPILRPKGQPKQLKTEDTNKNKSKSIKDTNSSAFKTTTASITDEESEANASIVHPRVLANKLTKKSNNRSVVTNTNTFYDDNDEDDDENDHYIVNDNNDDGDGDDDDNEYHTHGDTKDRTQHRQRSAATDDDENDDYLEDVIDDNEFVDKTDNTFTAFMNAKGHELMIKEKSGLTTGRSRHKQQLSLLPSPSSSYKYPASPAVAEAAVEAALAKGRRPRWRDLGKTHADVIPSNSSHRGNKRRDDSDSSGGSSISGRSRNTSKRSQLRRGPRGGGGSGGLRRQF